MAVELDYMEYANNAAAQAAYVSSDAVITYGSDVLTGGTPSASSEYSETYVASKACDNNETTRWAGENAPHPQWWKYDLGVGVTKTVRKFKFKAYINEEAKNFLLQGSNNDSDWDTLLDDVGANTDEWQTFTFANSTAYRYYRFYIEDNYAGTNGCSFWEIEMMERTSDGNLQCYSEFTIKQQGSYSLKAVAVQTDSLDDTLTRTIT